MKLSPWVLTKYGKWAVGNLVHFFVSRQQQFSLQKNTIIHQNNAEFMLSKKCDWTVCIAPPFRLKTKWRIEYALARGNDMPSPAIPLIGAHTLHTLKGGSDFVQNRNKNLLDSIYGCCASKLGFALSLSVQQLHTWVRKKTSGWMNKLTFITANRFNSNKFTTLQAFNLGTMMLRSCKLQSYWG